MARSQECAVIYNNRFLGVLNGGDVRQAEIIPVEPEQGNACAGKVKPPHGASLASFTIAAFLKSIFQH